MTSTIEDKTKRPTKFDGPGLNFKAKLIGLEDVADPRGDKMCQVAMAKSKAAVLAIGDHKQRIIVNISLDGIKLLDEKTENALHHHPVHRISFISRDTNDSRAFGYVYNREDGAHQFVGIKTEKAAEPLVACLRDLFQTVVEMKRGKDKEQPQIDTPIQITEVKDENKEKRKEEREEEKKVPPPHPPPPSNDLLGLDTGLEQGVKQMNAFGPGSPSAWLDDSLFQSQPGTSAVVPGQTGSMSMTQQPGLMVAGVGASSSFPPQQPMAGIAVASAMYHQQHTYPQQQQQVPGMQNSPVFGLPPAVFPAPVPSQSAAFGGMPANAWPQPQPPRGPAGMDPSPPTWMSFDSGIFGGGDLSATGNPVAAFASVPIHSTTTSGSGTSGDPFASSSSFPDPFADLAVLPTQGQSSSSAAGGKKGITKDDFNKDPPKPTLLDLTNQQQQQQADPTATTPAQGAPGQGTPGPIQLQDPFSAVSQPRRAPYNPFSSSSSPSSEGQTFSSNSNPFADSYHSTVDKSGAALHRPAAALDSDGGSVVDRDGLSAGPVTRPRPKGNAGTRPGLSLPLPSKNNADPFGISSA